MKRRMRKTLWIAVIASLFISLSPPAPGRAAQEEPQAPPPEKVTQLLGELETAGADEADEALADEALAAPELAPLPAAVALPEVELSGTAPVGSTVTVFYRKGGQVRNVGPLFPNDSGVFETGMGLLDGDGMYEFYATSEQGGQTRAASASRFVELDGLAPSEPVSKGWSNPAWNQVLLQWDPPYADPNQGGDDAPRDPTVDRYEVFRDGAKVGETEGLFYLDADLPESGLFQYEIYTVDRAGNRSGEAMRLQAGTFHRNAVEVASVPRDAGYNQGVYSPTLSKDGTKAAFIARLYSLPDSVPPATNSLYNVYTYDVLEEDPAKRYKRIGSLPQDLSDARRYKEDGLIAMSGDGNVVAYVTRVTLTTSPDLYIYDSTTGYSASVLPVWAIDPKHLALSDDGAWLVFQTDFKVVQEDKNEHTDIYLYHRPTKTVKLISKTNDGVVANDFSSSPAISGDGRYAAFLTDASNMPGWQDDAVRRLYVYDTGLNTLQYVPVPFGDDRLVSGMHVSLSEDGQTIALQGIVGDRDVRVYVHDRRTGTTESIASHLGQGLNLGLGEPHISADGRYVAFSYYNRTPGSPDTMPFDSAWGSIRYDRVEDAWSYLGNRAHPVTAPTLSGDGARAAFLTGDGLGSSIHIACFDGPCTDAEQPEMQLSTLTWSQPSRVGGQLPLGANVAIQAFGTPGLEVQAIVRYTREGERTATLPMTEDAQRPGIYRSTFAPPEGASDITGIRAEVLGHPEVSAEAPAADFPLRIAGEATVKLEGAYAASLGDGQVRLSSAGLSPAYRAYAKFGGNDAATVSLPGPATYAVEVLDGRGARLREQAEIVVANGGRVEVSLAPKPSASFAVKLVTANDDEVKDAHARFFDADAKLLETAKWEAGAGYRLRGNRYAEESIVVAFELPAKYEAIEPLSRTLAPGANELVLPVALRPDGTIRGVVTDQQGQPAPGVTVSLASRERIESKTTTDDNGNYVLRGPIGSYTLRADRAAPPSYQMATPPVAVEIAEGSELDIPLRVTDRGRGYLTIHLQYTPLDEPSRRLPVDDWRQAVDYGITATGGKQGVFADPWRGGDNRIPIDASPGDTVEVCSRGLLDDHARVCSAVTLDDRRNATARLELTEKARIAGRIVGEAINYAALRGTLYRKVAGGWSFAASVPFEREGRFAVRLSQAGEYRLELTEGNGFHRRTANREVTAVEGSIVELPPIELVKHGAFAFENQQGNALHAKSEAAPGEVVTLRGSYGNSLNQAALGASLLLEVPPGAALQEDSVMLNGAAASPAKQPDGRYRVPVGDIAPGGKGSVSYRLKLAETMDRREEARLGIVYRIGNAAEPREETIGSVFLNPVSVTLEAPRLSASHQIYVSGRAPAGRQVTIYADRETVGVAETSPGGFWEATVTLPAKPDAAIWRESPVYELQAKAPAGDAILQSDPVRVSVDASHAVVTNITMEQSDGRRVSLDPTKGVSKFPYVIVPGMPFYLDAEIQNADRVSNVTFWVGDTPVAAQRKGTSNAFGGYLIPYHSLKTGIYVTYDVAPKEVEARTPPTVEQWRAYRQSASGGGFGDTDFARATPAETLEAFGGAADDGFFHSPAFKLTFPNGTVAYARLSLKGIDRPASSYTNFKVDKNAATGTVTFSSIVPTSAMTREAQVAFKRFAAEAQLAGDQINTDHVMNVMSYVSPDAKLTGVLGHLNAAKGYVEDALDFSDYADALLDFQNQVIDSECHAPSVNHYIQETERIFERAHEMLVLKQITAGIGLVAGVVTGGLGGLAFASALTILGDSAKATWQQELDLLKKDFEENKKWRDDMAAAGAIERCKEPPEDEEDDDRPKDEDKVADPVWIWDPSGYVYEAVASNRVEGVKATILYQDPQDGSWSPWDAAWYGQANPLYTDANGRYGWDVPEGKWKVLYEKDGYLPAESEELTVLPVHLDVNIPMTSTAPPAVTEALAFVDGARLTFDKPMLVDSFGAGDVSLAKGSEDVPGVLEALDAEAMADGRLVAKTFRYRATLEAGVAYTVRVSTKPVSYAATPMASGYESTATATGPLEVQSVEVVPSAGELLLRWKEAGFAPTDRVSVFWKLAGAGTYTEERNVEVPAGARFAYLSELAPDTEYDVKLAINAAGDPNAPGRVVRAKTLDAPALVQDSTPPAVVGSPRATNVGADRADIVWTDPADDDFRSAIVVWRKVGDAAFSEPAYVEKGVSKLELRGLSPSTEYVVSIVAADVRWNESQPADVAFRTGASGGSGGDDGDRDGTSKPDPADREEAALGRDATEWSGFDGSVSLRFAEGTFERERKLTATRRPLDPATLPAGMNAFSYTFELAVEGVSATAAPFELSLAYDAAAAAGVDARKLGVYRLENGVWRYVGGVLDSARATVTAELATFGVYAVLVTDKTFDDLNGHWSQEAVEVLASRFVVDGFEDDSFRPEQPLTRAQFAKLLVELVGRREDGEPAPAPTFVDVAEGAWYAGVVARASALGLVRGSDGRFRPDEAVTREELAVLIVRALGLEAQAEAKAASLAEAGTRGAFRDGADIADWAVGAVELARELALLNGMGDGTFAPTSETTRAQGAAMLLRLMERRGDVGK